MSETPEARQLRLSYPVPTSVGTNEGKGRVSLVPATPAINPKSKGRANLHHKCATCADLTENGIWYGCDKSGCMADGFKGFVPYVAPAPESLNGCESCIQCPVDAKKGDTCPTREKNYLTSKIGMSASMMTSCAFFVEKTCQNCGNNVSEKLTNTTCGVHSGAACTTAQGRTASRQRDPVVEVGDYWTPRTTTPPTEKIEGDDAVAKFVTHSWMDSPDANLDCQTHGQDNYNLVVKTTPFGYKHKYLIACGDCVTDRFKVLEKAEADLAEKGRELRAEIANRNLLEKERNELRRVSAERQLQNQGLKAELAHRIHLAPGLDYIKQDFDGKTFTWFSEKVVNTMVAAAEQRATAFEKQYNEKVPEYARLLKEGIEKAKARAQAAEARLTPLTDMLAQQQKANDNLAGIGEKMEVHVPWWARHYCTPCQSCKHAPFTSRRCKRCDGAGRVGYSPRYTRGQRRAASDKEQARQAKKALEKMDVAYITLQKKGLEAVVAQYEADLARVKVLKKRLAASVPLENAIRAEITTERVDVENWKTSGDGWRTKITQLLRVALPDGEIADPKDVVLFKKGALPKTEEKKDA